MNEETKILSPTEIMRGLCNRRRNSDIRADDKELRELLESAFDSLHRERDEANETLGRTVDVRVGTSVLTRDLVWCGGCARGLSRTGNWYHCPQCGGKIDQESYVRACNEATQNGLDISRYVSGDRADLIKTLEGERDRQYEFNAEMIAKYAALESQLAAAIEAGKADKWQSIETAPREGRMFIGFAIVDTQTGNWRMAIISHNRYREVGMGESGWVGWPRYSIEPTHWMPLPAAPSAMQAAQVEPSETAQKAGHTDTERLDGLERLWRERDECPIDSFDGGFLSEMVTPSYSDRLRPVIDKVLASVFQCTAEPSGNSGELEDKSK